MTPRGTQEIDKMHFLFSLTILDILRDDDAVLLLPHARLWRSRSVDAVRILLGRALNTTQASHIRAWKRWEDQHEKKRAYPTSKN